MELWHSVWTLKCFCWYNIIILLNILGLAINTGQCHQVGCLSERWQARQGDAKLPIQILGALIGKSAIIGVMGSATLPWPPDIVAYPWEINHTFMCWCMPATGVWPSQGN
jgi:hypothetical protein